MASQAAIRERRAEVARLYADGVDLLEIARRMNVTENTIVLDVRHLARAGLLQMRRPRKPT